MEFAPGKLSEADIQPAPVGENDSLFSLQVSVIFGMITKAHTFLTTKQCNNNTDIFEKPASGEQYRSISGFQRGHLKLGRGSFRMPL